MTGEVYNDSTRRITLPSGVTAGYTDSSRRIALTGGTVAYDDTNRRITITAMPAGNYTFANTLLSNPNQSYDPNNNNDFYRLENYSPTGISNTDQFRLFISLTAGTDPTTLTQEVARWTLQEQLDTDQALNNIVSVVTSANTITTGTIGSVTVSVGWHNFFNFSYGLWVNFNPRGSINSISYRLDRYTLNT